METHKKFYDNDIPSQGGVFRAAAPPSTRPISQWTWRVVFGALILSWISELLAFSIMTYGWAPSLAKDLLDLVTLILLGSTTMVLIFQARVAASVRTPFLVAAGILVTFGLLVLLKNTTNVSVSMMLGMSPAFDAFLLHGLFVTGALIILGSFYTALLQGEKTAAELDQERCQRADLLKEHAETESTLRLVHDELDNKVALRTAELAADNEKLRLELTELQQLEISLEKRLQYEEGLAACSQFLLSDSNPAEAFQHALDQLVQTTGVSHVGLIFREQQAPQDLLFSLKVEAFDPTHCQTQRSAAIHKLYAQDFKHWHELLAAGHPFTGTTETFQEPERTLLEEAGIKSLLLLPIGWQGNWKGYLAFADMNAAHHWDVEEIRLLQTAAEMVGACMDRHHSEKELRQAYEDLERRIGSRTADLQRANEQLLQEINERRQAEKEKRRLETQLRHAQKMQAIGTLAGGIAHDFNNILSSVLGFSELGLHKISSDSPLKRYFAEIYKSGIRAKELVRQILLFSRQMEHPLAPVHLHLIVQEALAVFRNACPGNIDLKTRITPTTEPIEGDVVQLHQLVMNLLTNARDAMLAQAGEIELQLEPVHLEKPPTLTYGKLPAGDYIRLMVADTGVGMDPHTLDRIFEPFFTTKPVGEGTGMGLALVHGVVMNQHGGILVESKVRQGTKIQLFFPLAAPHQNTSSDISAATLCGSETIMVVDDEPQLIMLWQEILEKFGYTVVSFTNSMEALAHFKTNPTQIDLILCDQTMPFMTGTELAENILTARPDIPIILATGFSESVTPEKAKEIGIHEFVYKPILGDELGLAIRKALDQKTSVSEHP